MSEGKKLLNKTAAWALQRKDFLTAALSDFIKECIIDMIRIIYLFSS